LRDGDCSEECILGGRRIRRIALEQSFAASAMRVGFIPALAGAFS